MLPPVRIGNAHGFWGDRLTAAAEMLAREPDLDYLTLDFLAEVSMSILALQRERDPSAGYVRDVVDVVRSLAPYWRAGGRCRLVTNGGGLDPVGCGEACQRVLAEAGCHGIGVAVVTGDDVLPMLLAEGLEPGANWSRNLDTGAPLETVADRLVTANAYVGAGPVAEALAGDPRIVVTGRVADPSLVVGCCVHHFGWAWDAWDQLAGATVAGHLVECGTQVTGGIETDWLAVPDPAGIGFPIVEVDDSGGCVVTKPRGTGGHVTPATVSEQLVYEIGDPGRYLSPDVVVSFLDVEVEPLSEKRLRVHGARGAPFPETHKVSATYRDGFRAEGRLVIHGESAVAKAQRAADALLERLRRDGATFADVVVETLGASACRPPGTPAPETDAIVETVLRIAVADDDREHIEAFSRSLMSLVTAGPPGTTGYADGRPRVRPRFRYWPCLVPRDLVRTEVSVLTPLDATETAEVPAEPWPPAADVTASDSTGPHDDGRSPSRDRLIDVARARSGDKGRHANIGVIARRADDYERLREELSVDRVAEHLGIADASRVTRYEWPRLAALNFVVHDILADGLRTDAQGKTLGQWLLNLPIDSERWRT